jgi:hypothetical protein
MRFLRSCLDIPHALRASDAASSCRPCTSAHNHHILSYFPVYYVTVHMTGDRPRSVGLNLFAALLQNQSTLRILKALYGFAYAYCKW